MINKLYIRNITTYSLETNSNWKKWIYNMSNENLEEINKTSVKQNLEKFVEKKSIIIDLVSSEYTITIDLSLMEIESKIKLIILFQFIYF